MPKVAVNKKNSSQLSETSLTTEPGIDDSEKNDSSNLEDQMGSYGTVSNFSKTTKKVEKDSTKTRKSAINVKRAKPKRKLSEDDLVNPLGTEMNKQMPVSSVSHLASNSTILKKNERKSFQKNVSQPIKASAVFVMNVKVIPNKAKRFEKDKKTKFSIETVNRDYFNKLKEQCKGLFIDDFSKKIFNDDFRKQVEAFKKMEEKKIPENLDYNEISGLRLEARQKLIAYDPVSIGQASRISGVSPADISVLLVYLKTKYNESVTK